MTRTVEQRARELLAKHIGILATQEDDDSPYIAALTEALARIEELEGALSPFIAEYEAQEMERSPSVQDSDKPYQFYFATYGDLRRATLSKGIT